MKTWIILIVVKGKIVRLPNYTGEGFTVPFNEITTRANDYGHKSFTDWLFIPLPETRIQTHSTEDQLAIESANDDPHIQDYYEQLERDEAKAIQESMSMCPACKKYTFDGIYCFSCKYNDEDDEHDYYEQGSQDQYKWSNDPNVQDAHDTESFYRNNPDWYEQGSQSHPVDDIIEDRDIQDEYKYRK
jgi:hypothetical protein